MGNLIFYSQNYSKVGENKITNVEYEILPLPDDANFDVYIKERIFDRLLKEQKFDNIFIPLSPFRPFSEYLGLHIALYLKLQNSINKLSNLFIYGIDPGLKIFASEYTEVFKFSEVKLIDYSNQAILQNINSESISTIELWQRNLAKIHLNVPKNYFDNHSIANEWGIFQMARNAGINIESIKGFDLSKFERIYFKWLIAKNGLDKPIEQELLNVPKVYAEQLKGIKIVGTIDLSKFEKRK